MHSHEALHIGFQPLKPDSTVAEALVQMDKLEVKCLPIVDTRTNKLVGQVWRSQLEDVENGHETPVSSLEIKEAIKIYRQQHVFEAIRLMLQYEVRYLPVVDDSMTYKGTLQKQQVLELLSHMLNLSAHGSVLTIVLEERDFTLAEIVHLIESEGAKILGLTVETPDSKSGTFEISLKLNLGDVSRVVSTLRRYNYTVYTETKNELVGIDLETRAEELVKYIDM